MALRASLAAVVALVAGCRSDPARPATPPPSTPAAARPAATVRFAGEPRLRFEPIPAPIGMDWDFWSYGGGYDVRLDPDRLELRAAGAGPITMRLVGGDPHAVGHGGERLAWLDHYTFAGQPDVATPGYQRVSYHDVYDRIDVVYHGAPGDLRYDFLVAPGGDPRRIRLAFDGAERVAVDHDGALVVAAAGGRFRHQDLHVYQQVAGARRAIPARFVVDDQGAVGVAVGAYDHAAPLVIDPAVLWVTYTYAAGVDSAAAVAIDDVGNTYVTGTTQLGQVSVVYVRKLGPDGDVVVQRTIAQTTGSTQPRAIAVSRGAAPVVYVAGMTSSPNLAATPGVIQFGCPKRFNQGACNGNRGFVATFDETLHVRAVTYLSGSVSDEIDAAAVDAAGRVYLTGLARSPDFPGTPLGNSQGVVDPTRIAPFTGITTTCKVTAANGQCEDAFLAVLTPDLARLTYFTYLGGKGTDVGRGLAIAPDLALAGRRTVHVVGGTDGNFNLAAADRFPTTNDPHGNRIFPDPFVAAQGATDPADAFALAIVLTDQGNQTDGAALFYSTYLGGSGFNVASGATVDEAGNLYLTGQTASTDLRDTSTWTDHYDLRGPTDAFVCQIDRSGGGMGYCGYLGGDGSDAGRAIAVARDGTAYVTGTTTSATGLPEADVGFQTACAGASCDDSFVAKIRPRDLQQPAGDPPVEWSSYLGGGGFDTANGIAVDGDGVLHVVGTTISSDLASSVSGGLLTAREGYHGSSDGFAVAVGECGGPPLDLATAGAPPFTGMFAGGQPVAVSTRFAGMPDWHARFRLDGDDGFAMEQVILGSRYMADSIDVPYVKVALQGEDPLTATRCQLTRDRSLVPACTGACCANLIALHGPHQVRQDKLFVEATYEIDLEASGVPDASPGSCLRVSQRYELYSEAASSKGEPAGKVKISRFRPIVSYQYVGDPVAGGQFRVYAPVRLALRPSDTTAPGDNGVAAFIHDVDFINPNLGTETIVDPLVKNPIPVEAFETVIDHGQPVPSFPVYYGGYRASILDNLHYSPEPGVIDLPLPFSGPPPNGYLPLIAVPGCPRCVHIHWRWGELLPTLPGAGPLFAGFPQFNPGMPLIPPGSNQSLRVAVVKAHAGEEDPADLRDLVQPTEVTFAGTTALNLLVACNTATDPRCEEIVDGNEAGHPPPVEWFEFTGYQPQDVFFRFGGFFAAVPAFSFDAFPPPDGDPIGP